MRATVGRLSLFTLLLVVAAAVETAAGTELQAQGLRRSAGAATSEASRKIVSSLRALIADVQAAGNPASDAQRFSSTTLRVDKSARVHVYVTVANTDDTSLAVLRAHGLDIEIVSADFAIVQGWIPIGNLESLANESAVQKIRPPDYGAPDTGPVNSEGDATSRRSI